MAQALEIARHYTNEIKNDRTPMDAFEHLEEEVAELKVELQNGNTGPDGVKGEVIDVLNCALDVLFLVHPEIAMAEIDRLMEAKCRKWMIKYSKEDEVISDEGVVPSVDILNEFKECEVNISIVAQVAGIEPNSVKRIRAGSLPSRRTQKRLNEVFPVLEDAFKGYYWGVANYWRKKSRDGQTLQGLLSAPVIDLAAVRLYFKEMEPSIETFKSRYIDYRNDKVS